MDIIRLGPQRDAEENAPKGFDLMELISQPPKPHQTVEPPSGKSGAFQALLQDLFR